MSSQPDNSQNSESTDYHQDDTPTRGHPSPKSRLPIYLTISLAFLIAAGALVLGYYKVRTDREIALLNKPQTVVVQTPVTVPTAPAVQPTQNATPAPAPKAETPKSPEKPATPPATTAPAAEKKEDKGAEPAPAARDLTKFVTPATKPLNTNCVKLDPFFNSVSGVSGQVSVIAYGYDQKVMDAFGDACATVLVNYDTDSSVIDKLRKDGNEVGLLFRKFPEGVRFEKPTDPTAIAWWQEIGRRFGDNAPVQTIPKLEKGSGFTVPTTIHPLVSGKHKLLSTSDINSLTIEGGDIIVIDTAAIGTDKSVKLVKQLVAKLNQSGLTTTPLSALLEAGKCEVKS